jgi:hypothetical protein
LDKHATITGRRGLQDAYTKNKINKLFLIGDAFKPRKMLDAIREGYDEAGRG